MFLFLFALCRIQRFVHRWWDRQEVESLRRVRSFRCARAPIPHELHTRYHQSVSWDYWIEETSQAAERVSDKILPETFPKFIAAYCLLNCHPLQLRNANYFVESRNANYMKRQLFYLIMKRQSWNSVRILEILDGEKRLLLPLLRLQRSRRQGLSDSIRTSPVRIICGYALSTPSIYSLYLLLCNISYVIFLHKKR